METRHITKFPLSSLESEHSTEKDLEFRQWLTGKMSLKKVKGKDRPLSPALVHSEISVSPNYC